MLLDPMVCINVRARSVYAPLSPQAVLDPTFTSAHNVVTFLPLALSRRRSAATGESKGWALTESSRPMLKHGPNAADAAKDRKRPFQTAPREVPLEAKQEATN